ncbi:MAG: hypothetical protein OEZ15_05895 [Gammaproteobacteria bacterium]|nr:hypothetical protein [Gammaproteobacteria bacterium]
MNKKGLYVVLLFMLLTGCSTEYSAVYQSASAESKWDESQRIIINDSKQVLPNFKVIENKLYLMIQSKKVGWFFNSETEYPSWDAAEMDRFVKDRPEIKKLVPVDWNNWLPMGFGEECKEKAKPVE